MSEPTPSDLARLEAQTRASLAALENEARAPAPEPKAPSTAALVAAWAFWVAVLAGIVAAIFTAGAGGVLLGGLLIFGLAAGAAAVRGLRSARPATRRVLGLGAVYLALHHRRRR